VHEVQIHMVHRLASAPPYIQTKQDTQEWLIYSMYFSMQLCLKLSSSKLYNLTNTQNYEIFSVLGFISSTFATLSNRTQSYRTNIGFGKQLGFNT
jgi:hypothetical protein